MTYGHVTKSPRLSLCFSFGPVKGHNYTELLSGRRESLGTRLAVCTYRVVTIILPIVEQLVVLKGHGFRINVIYMCTCSSTAFCMVHGAHVATCSWLMAS